jgi:hypothetical protein
VVIDLVDHCFVWRCDSNCWRFDPVYSAYTAVVNACMDHYFLWRYNLNSKLLEIRFHIYRALLSLKIWAPWLVQHLTTSIYRWWGSIFTPFKQVGGSNYSDMLMVIDHDSLMDSDRIAWHSILESCSPNIQYLTLITWKT